MFGGISDSGLSSWSFWLQSLGIGGGIVVVLSLLGMHFIHGEIYARGQRTVVVVAPAAVDVSAPAVVPALAVGTPARPAPKVDIALAKPVGREITEAQKSSFVRELAHAPKRPIEVFIYDQSPEIRSYAEQVRVLLAAAGYDGGPAVKSSAVPSFSPAGLLIVVKNPARAPSYAGALQNAFKTIGIDALGAKDDDFSEDQVAVVVGRRLK